MTKKVLFPVPNQDILRQFIIESNNIERVEIQLQEILDTYDKKWIHPVVGGHFMATDYTLNLAANPTFPVKDPYQFSDKEISDKNLYWIRDIHFKLFCLIPKLGERFPKIQKISIHDCGNYRLQEHYAIQFSNDFTNESDPVRKFPKYISIQDLMHFFYKTLGEFHLKYASKLEKPQSMKFNEWEELSNKAYEFHLMLQCIHPWIEGTGRTARLVENALRLRWGLGWKTIKAKNSIEYINDIRKYENSPYWQNVLKEYNAKP